MAQDTKEVAASRHSSSEKRAVPNLMRGTALKKSIVIADPSLKRVFVNSYPYTNSRLYLITQFGPNVMDATFINDAIMAVERLITKEMKKIDDRIEQLRVMMEANMVECGEKFNPFTVDCIVNSRLSNIYLKFFEISDKYILHMNSLWMEGLISESEKNKSMGLVNRSVNAIMSLCVTTCAKIITKLSEKQKERQNRNAKAVISAIASNSQIKTDDTKETNPASKVKIVSKNSIVKNADKPAALSKDISKKAAGEVVENIMNRKPIVKRAESDDVTDLTGSSVEFSAEELALTKDAT